MEEALRRCAQPHADKAGIALPALRVDAPSAKARKKLHARTILTSPLPLALAARLARQRTNAPSAESLAGKCDHQNCVDKALPLSYRDEER